MITDDLPNRTKAPELDDRNAAIALRADKARTGEDRSGGDAVTEDVVGLYLAFLAAKGFMPAPTQEGKRKIPQVQFGEGQALAMRNIGGRGR